MNIIEVLTGDIRPVEIVPVEPTDYTRLSLDRYFFDWSKEKAFEVFKLKIKGESDILGLVSYERIPEEWRIHIRLLTVSQENSGKGKQYERIAGNLLAHVSKIAVSEYGELACVSLRPKTAIAKHYVDTYRMNVTGMTLSLEVPEILDLISIYDHD